MLGVLYRDYLVQDGIADDQIIMIELDNDMNARYRNPLKLGEHLRKMVGDTSKDYYILLDEIQMVESIENPYLPKDSGAKITFVDVLLGLKSLPNVDVYVTGSNSKMLSSDVATAFRDRGQEIHITPLTYDEFYLDCFIEAYILNKAYRYDIKGRSYIDSPLKYYFTDIGLRNALLNFRQQEENHIMENIIYNELKARGFNVDV